MCYYATQIDDRKIVKVHLHSSRTTDLYNNKGQKGESPDFGKSGRIPREFLINPRAEVRQSKQFNLRLILGVPGFGWENT